MNGTSRARVPVEEVPIGAASRVCLGAHPKTGAVTLPGAHPPLQIRTRSLDGDHDHRIARRESPTEHQRCPHFLMGPPLMAPVVVPQQPKLAIAPGVEGPSTTSLQYSRDAGVVSESTSREYRCYAVVPPGVGLSASRKALAAAKLSFRDAGIVIVSSVPGLRPWRSATSFTLKRPKVAYRLRRNRPTYSRKAHVNRLPSLARSCPVRPRSL